MFPPSYDGPLRDISPDSPEFDLLIASLRDLRGSGRKRRWMKEGEKGDEE